MSTRLASADLARRLVDAAARLLSEEGPSALSTRRLAAEVGTSTMAVYTHFGGLPQLVRAVVREGFDRLAAELAQIRPTGDSLTDLAAQATAYRTNARANPHLYAVMFGTASLGGYRQAASDVDEGRGTFDTLVTGVQQAMDVGALANGDAEQLAGQLWCALHGYVTLELAGYFQDPVDADTIMWPLLAAVVRAAAPQS